MLQRTVMMTTLMIGIAPRAAFAHDYAVGDLTLDHPVARATAQTAMTSAGYLTITNNGTEDDVLTGVEAAFPRVEVHSTKMQDGMMQMGPVGPLTIPAGETVTLEPDGLHVMFMGLNGDPFEVGEEIPATLMFENAGPVEVLFYVEDLSGGMDHSTMDHSNMNADEMDHGDMNHEETETDSN